MLGKVWSSMIILSFFYAMFTNKINDFSNAILEGTNQGINIILTTSGAIIFWSGIMKIAYKSGLTSTISNILFPLLKFLFPNSFRKKNIVDPMCINLISNMFGLSNAATPSGLKAISEMKKENIGFPDMATFVIMNMSSIQLAPTFLVALRKSFGSENPYQFIPKMWISSSIFLLTGIILVKISIQNPLKIINTKQKNNVHR